MSTNLTRIGVRARANPALVFTSLYHHITDIDNLRDCFRRLKGEKALGVDGVSKAMYEKDLEANLRDLSARLKRMGCRFCGTMYVTGDLVQDGCPGCGTCL